MDELPWWRESKNVAKILLMVAAVLISIYMLGDAYVVTNLISTGGVVATFTYLILGATTGLVLNYLLCQTPAGKFVDDSYTSVKSMPLNAMRGALVAGLIGATTTGIYLWAFQSVDASLVLPLSSIAAVYMAMFEAMIGRFSFRKVLPSLLLVIAGVTVASWSPSATAVITIEMLFLLLIVYNGLKATGELTAKWGIDRSDAVSFNFYRFVWLTVAVYVGAIAWALITNQFEVLVTSVLDNLKALPFIAVVQFVVFFAEGWASKGMRLSNATTKSLALSLPAVFAVAGVAIVNFFAPGTFVQTPATLFEWSLRIAGTCLIIWGVYRIR